MRYFLIGYTAKRGGSEFSSTRGEVVKDGECLRPYSEIRDDCLDFVNRNTVENFPFLQINFITQVEECDYNSFMELDRSRG